MKKTMLAISLSALSLMSTNCFPAAKIINADGSTYSTNNGSIYQQQQQQNQNQNQQQLPQYGNQQNSVNGNSNDFGVTANARVDQEKQKNTSPKTAAEQGYVSEEDQEAIQEGMDSYKYMNTARQKGITIQVPTSDDGVAKDKKYKMWLFNWKGRLLDQGISSQKIDFEASRLNKDDFERWASREIRYGNGN